ncbi:MAG: YidC/Oxa1 family insertase periplasmic-domain containing protein [Sedimentisphaerales bacterium]|nr:YidC/Oxa1 family insertase periplasmic-domain containing protein [Sedimentisphaerales bacterium]
MNTSKNFLIFFVVSFVVFCGYLVVESGIFTSRQTSEKACILLQKTAPKAVNVEAADELPKFVPAELINYQAFGAGHKTIRLGSLDKKSGFKFEIELTSKGAAINKATFSEFDDRNYENPQPLTLLSTVQLQNGKEIKTMANKEFVFVDQQLQLRLDRLNWKSLGIEKDYLGTQTARFEAVIKDMSAAEPIIKLTKTYTVSAGSYHLDCSLTVENLSNVEQKVQFNLTGPTGIDREAIRSDMRNVIGGFVTSSGEIVSSRKDLRSSFFSKKVDLKKSSYNYEQALRSGDKVQISNAKQELRIGRNLPAQHAGAKFLWAAVANKYFAAIARPMPDKEQENCDWIADKLAFFYNPDGDQPGNSGDETVGIEFKIAQCTISPSSQTNNAKTYNFQLYIGPKDKDVFYSDELYKKLGFIHTITFMPCCCCPASIISPLAFAILGFMNWLYSFIGNYGVAIIILVFLIRMVLHPLTKKSQVSMNKFSKVLSAPEVQEIRKKYAKNHMEMNKRILAYQKEQGLSPMTPVMGMLPMFVQMPIWISLYSAIYASIALRGAPFLPFWITDLSAPDALIRFSAIKLPIFGAIESFNLLPILMGIAFYMQQKLMPKQAAEASNPQMAQQQKMMMIMMPIMFPIFLYKAPSGLNLYIMASTFAGVIEQYIIRKHIHQREMTESTGLVATTSKAGGKAKKKKPKPFYKQF